MNTRCGLTLCMIVKNEADILSDCIKSVRPIIDEIILVDTGSTDKTPDIGSEYGARVFSLPWENDFSKARNYAIQKVETDWILVLDADEIISATDHPALTKLLINETAFGFILDQRTYGNDPNFTNWEKTTGQYPEEKGFPGYISSPLIRLFRNDPRIVFEGAVHELVEPAFSTHRLDCLETTIPIHHYGKVRGDTKVREKANCYLLIGKRKASENPRSAKAFSELGAQHLELKDYKNAAEAFKTVIRLKPEDPGGYADLGVTFLRAGRLSDAETHLRQAMTLHPKNVDALFNLGAVYLHQSRFDAAESCFQKVLGIQPEFGNAYASLGAVHLCCDRPAEAIPYLLKATQLNPGDADAHSNLAKAYMDLCWIEHALESCHTALNIFPGHQNALNIKEQAMNLFQEKQPIDPAHTRNMVKKGEDLFASGDIPAARTQFEEATKANPFGSDAWNNLGVLEWMQQNKQGALDFFLRTLLINPEHPDARENIKGCCNDLNKKNLLHLLPQVCENLQ